MKSTVERLLKSYKPAFVPRAAPNAPRGSAEISLPCFESLGNQAPTWARLTASSLGSLSEIRSIARAVLDLVAWLISEDVDRARSALELRQRLKLLNSFIRILLDHIEEFQCGKLGFLVQLGWFFLHGDHPPRIEGQAISALPLI
ncbi:MAG TPA: hypothetical protein VHU83_10490 [Bryobacteraceae bacterium]|jgi:hypothetical protein|nr:hypothetical protein [Bryobacteraceae bacterium]